MRKVLGDVPDDLLQIVVLVGQLIGCEDRLNAPVLVLREVTEFLAAVALIIPQVHEQPDSRDDIERDSQSSLCSPAPIVCGNIFATAWLGIALATWIRKSGVASGPR